jgi:hypothetical protein
LYIEVKNMVFNFIPSISSLKAGGWKLCGGQNDVSKWSNIVWESEHRNEVFVAVNVAFFLYKLLLY